MQLDRIPPRDEAEEKLLQYISSIDHSVLLPERKLQKHLGLSRTTLNFAIKKLKRQGILSSKRGSGTYLNSPKYTKYLHTLHSWTEFAIQNQLKLVSKIIDFSMIEADKPLAQKLKIMVGDNIYCLSRIIFINNEPLILETTYLSVDRFENLSSYNFSTTSLYKILKDQYQIVAYKGNEQIKIALLNKEEAEALQTPLNSLAFIIDALIWDIDNTPIEAVHSIIRADKFEFGNLIDGRETHE